MSQVPQGSGATPCLAVCGHLLFAHHVANSEGPTWWISGAWAWALMSWARRAGARCCGMETPLEKALATLVLTFHKYSGKEGDKFTLSRGELKALVKNELGLGQKMKERNIDELMKTLDKNSDDEIDFKEYSAFLSALCMAYNDFFQQDGK
ncbi:protein S100-A5 isoform X1 [Alligator sinensis]|uniref:Protein S100 n=2 Tax=Alligator sinensis TaxID=38654 RepID=A0A1U7SID4_ALLSI|nr:protein S100-A5 isoform X1 [Alligator sinensis]